MLVQVVLVVIGAVLHVLLGDCTANLTPKYFGIKLNSPKIDGRTAFLANKNE